MLLIFAIVPGQRVVGFHDSHWTARYIPSHVIRLAVRAIKEARLETVISPVIIGQLTLLQTASLKP